MVAFVGCIWFVLFAYFYRDRFFVAFLFATYAFSFLSTLLLRVLGFYKSVSLEWLPLLYLMVILGFVFTSFSTESRKVKIEEVGRLKILADVFLFLGILSVVFYAYHSFLLFSSEDITTVRLAGKSFVKSGIFNTIFSVISTLYFVPMFIFFLFVKENIYGLYRKFLLLSTISFPLLCLSYGGRDGLIFWSLNFVVLFLFFQREMQADFKRNILRIVKLAFPIVAVILGFITVKRFGFGKDALLSMLDYVGQQFVHFSNTFYCDNSLFGEHSHVFAGWEGLLKLLFTGEKPLMPEQSPIIISGINEYNVFSFFVSAFTRDYGKFGAMIVLLLFSLVVRRYISRFEVRDSIFDLIIVFVLFQIPMNGLFYYRQGIGNGDVIYTLFVFFVAVYSRLKFRRHVI